MKRSYINKLMRLEEAHRLRGIRAWQDPKRAAYQADKMREYQFKIDYLLKRKE